MTSFLEGIIKYKYKTPIAVNFYQNGDTGDDWVPKILDPSLNARVGGVYFSSKSYMLQITYMDSKTKLDTQLSTDNMVSTNGGTSYSGKFCYTTSKGKICNPATISPKVLSEYYFTKYQISERDRNSIAKEPVE